jgi:hypothetical protein
MGWPASSFRTNASAGGQLEQPSEVKSSIRTGRASAVGATAAVLLSACGTRPPATAVGNNRPAKSNADKNDGDEQVRDRGMPNRCATAPKVTAAGVLLWAGNRPPECIIPSLPFFKGT